MSAIIRDLRISSLSPTNQRIVTKGPFTNPNASADCLTSTSAPPDPLPSSIALISVEWYKPQRCLSIATRIYCAWPLFVTPSPTTEPRPYPDFVQTYFLTTRPLSDPGGVPFARLDANRTAAFRQIDTVGFGFVSANLSCCPPLYSFRSSMTRPGSRLTSASDTASQRSPFGSAADRVASLWSDGT